MDALSHALFGRLLGRLDVNRRLGPGSRAAFVIGALAPDADIVMAVSGWDRYLQLHEIGTHTIAASPLVGAAVAAGVRMLVKESRFVNLWWSAWTSALLGHLIFDLVSGSDMRILAPMYSGRFGPHWLAMADLLAMIPLIAGTIASIWRPRAAAIGTFVVLGLVLAAKIQTQHRASASFLQPIGSDDGHTRAAAPEAVNGSFFDWVFYERETRMLRVWLVNARDGSRVLRFERVVDPETEAQAARMAVPAVKRFLPLTHVPFPRIERDGSRQFLLWSDLRHCGPDWCALSVGAELDTNGTPIRQIIRIGPVEQSGSMTGYWLPVAGFRLPGQ